MDRWAGGLGECGRDWGGSVAVIPPVEEGGDQSAFVEVHPPVEEVDCVCGWSGGRALSSGGGCVLG